MQNTSKSSLYFGPMTTSSAAPPLEVVPFPFGERSNGPESHLQLAAQRVVDPVPGSAVRGARRLCKLACKIVLRHRPGVALRSALPLLLAEWRTGPLPRPDQCPLVVHSVRSNTPPQAAQHIGPKRRRSLGGAFRPSRPGHIGSRESRVRSRDRPLISALERLTVQKCRPTYIRYGI